MSSSPKVLLMVASVVKRPYHDHGDSCVDGSSLKEFCLDSGRTGRFLLGAFPVRMVPMLLTLHFYPLSQNDYRQEKIIFELFSGALQENPVRAPGAIT